MMNTLAAGTVPAAVIIIGNARPYCFGGVDHRAISGEVGLARQHVHRLRAGDARHQFHGEGDEAGVRYLLERCVVAVRVHDAEHQRTLFHSRQFAGRRPPDLKHDVGAIERIGGHGGAGGGVVAIEHART